MASCSSIPSIGTGKCGETPEGLKLPCGPARFLPCAPDSRLPKLQGFRGTKLPGSRFYGGNVDRNPVVPTPCSCCSPATRQHGFRVSGQSASAAIRLSLATGKQGKRVTGMQGSGAVSKGLSGAPFREIGPHASRTRFDSRAATASDPRWLQPYTRQARRARVTP
jgi:hypothetical protein